MDGWMDRFLREGKVVGEGGVLLFNKKFFKN